MYGPIGGESREVEELVGVAENASSLSLVDTREGHLDRVAAFAMALRRAEGDGGAVRQVDAELGRALWRAAYAGDVACAAVAVGALEVALTLRLQSRVLRALACEPQRTGLLARRVVQEWVHDRCTSCRGSGSQEIRHGRRMPPAGEWRNATLVVCVACDGSGRAKPNRHARRKAIAIGDETIPADVYEREWAQVFRCAAYLCDRAAGNLRRPTMRALRGKR